MDESCERASCTLAAQVSSPGDGGGGQGLDQLVPEAHTPGRQNKTFHQNASSMKAGIFSHLFRVPSAQKSAWHIADAQ